MKRGNFNKQVLKKWLDALVHPDINEMDKGLLFLLITGCIEIFGVCVVYIYGFSIFWIGGANFSFRDDKDEKDLVSVNVIHPETVTKDKKDKGKVVHLTKDHKKDKTGEASYTAEKLKYDPKSDQKNPSAGKDVQLHVSDPTVDPHEAQNGVAPLLIVKDQESAKQVADQLKKSLNFTAEILPSGKVQELISQEFVDDGVPINIESNAGESKTFSSVEELPEYPGGQRAFLDYLSHNLQYPPYAKRRKIQGRVLVQFIVEKTGQITNISVGESANPVLDNEAIRVISRMPKWRPGKEKGAVVRVKIMVPVVFKL